MKREKLDLKKVVMEGLSEEDLDKLPGYREEIPPDYKKVIYVSWEEWEPCFWVRPEGCTLHLTEEDAKKYIEKFADRWIYPVGDPVPVYVSPRLYEKLLSRDNRSLLFNKLEESKLVKEGELIYTKKRSGWVTVDMGDME